MLNALKSFASFDLIPILIPTHHIPAHLLGTCSQRFHCNTKICECKFCCVDMQTQLRCKSLKLFFSQAFILRFHLQTNLPHPISSDESAQSTRPSQISLGFFDFRCSLQVQFSSSVPSSQSWILSQRWFKLITCEILKKSKLGEKVL